MRASPLSTAPAARRRAIEMAPAGGDIKRIRPGTAETAVVRQIGRERMRFQDRAAGREYHHQRTRPRALPAADRNDVAIGVEAHALDAAMRTAMVQAEAVQHDWMI